MSTASAPGRPLVTFALLAYNQEDYVREAVAGALAQEYQPLEIILSDDCSGDRTFAIMCEMAAAYDGPHKVTVRQSEINLGISAHLAAITKASTGALIVVAAGDDVSLPARTGEAAEEWLKQGKPTCVLHSRLAQFVDGTPDMRPIPLRFDVAAQFDLAWYLRNRDIPFMAPTAAYSRDLFDRFPSLPGGTNIEDGPLAIRVLLIGRVITIDKCLVHQRVLEQSAGQGYRIDDPTRWNRHITGKFTACVTIMRDIEHLGENSPLHRRVQRYHAKFARRLALFLVPARQSVGWFYKLIFVGKYALFYPGRASFALRVYEGLALAGWDFVRRWRKRIKP